jgi:O-antigen/teichoic acid export membrane protein
MASSSASNIGGRIASGAAWMVLFRIFERLIGVISTIILARLLMPADFGIIAMAMSVVAVLEIIWSFSFDSALIQEKSMDRSYFDSAWTLNVMLGGTMCVGLLLLAYPASVFYEDERLVLLISSLAIGAIFRGFENIGVVLFRKEMDFRAEFAYQLGRKLSGFVVTIPLAIIFRNYWALAAGMITSRLAALMLSYLVHPFRPRLSLEQWRSIVGFSKWLFLNSVLFAIQSRAQDFTIGKLRGAAGLGLYNVADEISTMATSEVVYPINRAVFPGFAKMAQEDPGMLLTGYLRVVSLVALITLPIGFGIAACAQWIVPVVLGQKWLEAIPVVEILGVYGALASLGSVFGPTLMATGRSRFLSVLSALNVAFFVPCVVYGAMVAGIIGAAWGSLAVVLVMLPLSHWLVARILSLPFSEVIRNLWRPLVATCLMYLLVRMFIASNGHVETFGSMAGFLALAVALGVVVYVGAVAALWLLSGRPEGGEKMVLEAVLTKLRNR